MLSFVVTVGEYEPDASGKLPCFNHFGVAVNLLIWRRIPRTVAP